MKFQFTDTKLYLPQVAEPTPARAAARPHERDYQYKETRELVTLVMDAAAFLKEKGEDAFKDFRVEGGRWRKGEAYIFVLDPEGNMLVHPDPELEGKNTIELKDVDAKPIIRGLIETVTRFPEKTEGWVHYQWHIPGELMPRWKSSFVMLVKTAGKSFIIGSGMYNNRMEREFIEDLVEDAVMLIEKQGQAAFPLFHDPAGPFLVKDSYVFVLSPEGKELVNPAFPTLEGIDAYDIRDTEGKYLNRDMLRLVETTGFGWVDYMWPKPGESVSTRKSAYVSKARIGNNWVCVGCGVYLADAPKQRKVEKKMTAPEVESFVREAAAILKVEGEKAYPKFRSKDSKWFSDNTYLFTFTMDGKRDFHAAEPQSEGRDDNNLKDSVGRPIVKMILDAANSTKGEGWIHYMYPEPGNIFPVWKSSFVKKVTYPSGVDYVVGCGIYNMEMDKAFIEDIVNRAATLVSEKGKNAFDILRDKKGQFRFMDTYVFVGSPDGVELVNPAQPSLEGRNLLTLKDLKGKAVVKEEIEAAMTEGSAWLECYWFRPGDNLPARKQTFVRKVQHGSETYIVGSGLYVDERAGWREGQIEKIIWENMTKEKMSETITRQWFSGEKATIARFFVKSGGKCGRHFHDNEEFCLMISGALRFVFDNYEVNLAAGESLLVPANEAHAIEALEDSEFIDFFAPVRQDWMRGEDQYLRR
ncbi:MAG: cache domain-containing protein [Flavisolibacter sp.]